MTEMPYVCLYNSYLEALEPFTEEEIGRIVIAMMRYSLYGELPEFTGNERFIWPTLQYRLDADKENYEKRCMTNRANGAKGGRPKKQSDLTETEKTERFFEKPKKPKEKEKKKEKENKKENIYQSVIFYLNEKAGTKFKPTTEKTKAAINARLSEGFTLDDFKTVIDKKCAEWIGDEKMEKYLRPETLFGTKFEGYLNAKVTNGRNGNNGQTARDTGKTERIGNYI